MPIKFCVLLSLDITFYAISCVVTSAYKLFINNHSVTFERNPILFNCSREFTQNLGISQPS